MFLPHTGLIKGHKSPGLKLLSLIRAFIFTAPDYLSEDISDDVGDGNINNVAW